MEPFIAEIKLFGGNFAPRGWAFCDGAVLSISQNQALFALIGTTYGGDGVSTFRLPDLRGRVPVHAGGGQAGPGLPLVVPGQTAGTETNTLTLNNLPAHTHSLNGTAQLSVNNGNADTVVPTKDTSLAIVNDGQRNPTQYSAYSSQAPNTALNAGTINGTTSAAGGSQPVPNMMPYLGINYIIATEGIFPSRP